MKRLAIIIPVFNGLDFTKTCLKEIGEQTRGINNLLEITTIVVNDGSTDGTQAWITNNYPQTILLNGDGSLWWSGGINMGIDYAMNKLHSDYILWWNNDIRAANDYFEYLSKNISQFSTDTIVGSKIYCEGEKDLVWSMGGRFNPKTGKRYMHGFKQTDKKEYNKKIEADWLPGMGTIIPSDIISSIGMVDAENFPQYHGDSDYTLRAKTKGFKIVVDPNLRIWNNLDNSGLLHGESLKGLIQSFKSVKSKYNLKKDLLFFKRFANSPLAYAFLAKEYFKYIAGFLKWQILGLFNIKKQ